MGELVIDDIVYVKSTLRKDVIFYDTFDESTNIKMYILESDINNRGMYSRKELLTKSEYRELQLNEILK